MPPPPPKEDNNESEGETDATAGGDEDELHLSRCPNCKNYGPTANLCSTCEDSGMTYIEDASGDSDSEGQGWRNGVMSSADEAGVAEVDYNTTGQCPNCENYGDWACYCSTCEDQSFIYE